MIIASRALTLRRNQQNIGIPIRLFAPIEGEHGWFCGYEIDWPEGQEARKAWGIDSVQALVLALQMIGTDIYTSSYHASGNLGFEGPGQGYGFPVPSTLRDLLIGNDLKDGI